MFKALVKKQMAEINVWLLQDKKKGKPRSKCGVVLLLLLYILLFGVIAGMFFGLSMLACEPLCAMGMDWLYFAVMSLMAVMLGVFGSVFSTFTTLYEAKDNELLLSMPIPPFYILTARLLGVYFWSFIYTAIAFVPAVMVYLMVNGFSTAALVCGVLMLPLLSVFVLALSCVLGWVVAKISAKLKNKSFITVIASIVFIAVYYFFYFKATELLQEFLANAAVIGSRIQSHLLPVYWLGQAGTGNFVSLLPIAAAVLAVTAMIVWVMSRSFIKMSTAGKTSGKRQYRKINYAYKSAGAALLGKELRRFTSSANYMLNCALGTLVLPIIGVAALIKADFLRGIAQAMQLPAEWLSLLVCAALCMAASLNDITAPSVSLEGKHLWVVQSLPVSPWQVLKAKLSLHLILTEIPILFCAVCVGIALQLDVFSALACIVLPMLFVLLGAAFGLFLNLKFPNLTWTNEVVPIKQSFATMASLFGGWLFVIGLGVLYLAVPFVTAPLYLLLCGVLILLLCAVLLVWLKKKGTAVFAAL